MQPVTNKMQCDESLLVSSSLDSWRWPLCPVTPRCLVPDLEYGILVLIRVWIQFRAMANRAAGCILQHLRGFMPETTLLKLTEEAASTPTRASSFRTVTAAGEAILHNIASDLSQHAPLLRLWRSPWFPAAHVMPDLTLHKGQIQGLGAVQRGDVYFQGLASMLPALCLDARPGMRVLDLCAAPGGKATLLAGDGAAMDGRGQLLAIDNDFVRLQRLVHTARMLLLHHGSNAAGGATRPDEEDHGAQRKSAASGRMGGAPADSSSLHLATHVANMTVFRADGRYLQVDRQGQPLDDRSDSAPGPSRGTPSSGQGGPFDRVLLDAPCSGSGSDMLLGISDSTSGEDGSEGGSSGDGSGTSRWTPDALGRHARRQKQLLWNAAVLLRPGGTLIYSTCSLSPEENEDVVQHLLDNMHQMKLCEVTVAPGFLAAASAAAASGEGASPASGVRRAASARLQDLLTRQQKGAISFGGDTAINKAGAGLLPPPSFLVEPLPAAPDWSVLPGLGQYKGRQYSKGMAFAVRLLPCWHHEGFFIAKLRKQA